MWRWMKPGPLMTCPRPAPEANQPGARSIPSSHESARQIEPGEARAGEADKRDESEGILEEIAHLRLLVSGLFLYVRSPFTSRNNAVTVNQMLMSRLGAPFAGAACVLRKRMLKA